MRLRYPLFALALLVLAGVAAPAIGQSDAPLDVGRFSGTWRLAYAPERGAGILHRAIDHAVEPKDHA